MKRQNLNLIYLILILSFIFTGCKKENLQLPNQEFVKLFGKWKCILAIGGGQSNGVGAPDMQHVNEIEFKDNGVYKKYKDSKKTEKGKFSFSEAVSIYNADTMPMLVFEETGFLNKKNNFKQLIEFHGRDTMLLFDNFLDGYILTYIRN